VIRYLRPLYLIVVATLFSVSTLAQGALTETTRPPAVNQTVISSLSTLPEADSLVYINPQRILNEALPKFMAEKDIAGIRNAFADVKSHVGVDPTRVEYVVIAMRFRKPAADLRFQPPEFISVTGGDFSAESLLTVARLAAGGRLRDESYNGKSISLLTIDPIAKEAEKNPFLKSFSEVAISAVMPNMIAAGSPAYVKAAIDAAGGKGRISAESLNSLLRDPNALISAAGSPWNSFSRSFGLMGTEGNDRAPRCDTRLGDFYLGVTMDATNFMLRGFINADNPDTAKIMNNLITGLMTHASSAVGPGAQTALKAIQFAAEENEVVVRADFPQQMLIEMIKQQMAPKKQDAPASAPTPTTPKKKTTVRRRTRKRG
jgi:hypothetical protein